MSLMAAPCVGLIITGNQAAELSGSQHRVRAPEGVREMINGHFLLFSCEILDNLPLKTHIRHYVKKRKSRNMQLGVSGALLEDITSQTKLGSTGVADLNDRVSSCHGLHRSPTALRLVVGSVVGLGLHVDLQAVRPRAGRQLPVESWQ